MKKLGCLPYAYRVTIGKNDAHAVGASICYARLPPTTTGAAGGCPPGAMISR